MNKKLLTGLALEALNDETTVNRWRWVVALNLSCNYDVIKVEDYYNDAVKEAIQELKAKHCLPLPGKSTDRIEEPEDKLVVETEIEVLEKAIASLIALNNSLENRIDEAETAIKGLDQEQKDISYSLWEEINGYDI